MSFELAIFPGTFDPITIGHMDLIHRAAALCKRLIVAVAQSAGKNPLLDAQKRLELTQTCLQDLPQVEVLLFSNLLVDFAKQHKATLIIRGIRGPQDVEYESQLANMNRKMAPEIETLLLPPSDGHLFVSSSMIREIAILQGDISAFVPPAVVPVLQEQFRE